MPRTSWNKGKKMGPHTEEWRKKVSATLKSLGHLPPSAKGKKRSEEFKEKIRRARTGVPRPELRGEKNVLWKGGITPINAVIRTSLEYKTWRRKVFDRDNYSCVECGDRQSKGHTVTLHADHILPFAHYPNSRFDVENGQTLCIDCHKKTGSYLRNDVETCTVFALT